MASIRNVLVSKQFNLFGLCGNFIWIGMLVVSMISVWFMFYVFQSTLINGSFLGRWASWGLVTMIPILPIDAAPLAP